MADRGFAWAAGRARLGGAGESGVWGALRGEWWGVALAVQVQRQAVDPEGVGQQVQQLTGVADGVGPAEPEAVVEVTVDALGIVATPVQPLEVRIPRGDRPDVLGPVELPLRPAVSVGLGGCGGRVREEALLVRETELVESSGIHPRRALQW